MIDELENVYILSKYIWFFWEHFYGNDIKIILWF